LTIDRILERSQLVPVDVDEAFAFFADAWNLEAITPPWLRFRIVEAPKTLEQGSLLEYRLRLFGVPIRWRTEIVEWQPPFGFTDVQLSGPYVAGSTRTGSRRRTVELRSTIASSIGFRTSRSPACSRR
jgi:ligand-binding SRPBCC domain-containing protein